MQPTLHSKIIALVPIYNTPDIHSQSSYPSYQQTYSFDTAACSCLNSVVSAHAPVEGLQKSSAVKGCSVYQYEQSLLDLLVSVILNGAGMSVEVL
jgi:hypothetical protein